MKRWALLSVVLLLALAEPAWADNCGTLADCFAMLQTLVAATIGLSMLAMFASFLLDFTPLGVPKGIIEAWQGKDLITGQELAWWERALGAVPLLSGIAALTSFARMAGKGDDLLALSKAAKKSKKSEDAADILKADPYNIRARNDYVEGFGVPKMNYWHGQAVANKHNVIIDVRATNKYSRPLLEGGAHPKWQGIKSKTINDLDTYIGARPVDRGKVGYFNPSPPRNVPDHLVDAVNKRYQQRASEFVSRADDMQGLKKSGVTVDQHGVVTHMDGKPFAGDHDVYQIIDAKTGERLTGQRAQDVINDLAEGPMNVQHGAHKNWTDAGPLSPKNQEIYDGIVKDHSVGNPKAEELLRISPNSAPTSHLNGQ